MITRLPFHVHCPCFPVVLRCACYFYFHLPPQSQLTVGQHWMVTLSQVLVNFLLDVGRRTREEHNPPVQRTGLIWYFLVLRLCVIWMLGSFTVTLSTNTLIVRLWCRRVWERGREAENGWRGWKEQREGGRRVCAYVRARALVRVTVSERESEREESARCSLHRSSASSVSTLCRLGEIQESIKLTIYKKWYKDLTEQKISAGLRFPFRFAADAAAWEGIAGLKLLGDASAVEDELRRAAHDGLESICSHWRKDPAREEICLRSPSLSFPSRRDKQLPQSQGWNCRHPRGKKLTEPKRTGIIKEAMMGI